MTEKNSGTTNLTNLTDLLLESTDSDQFTQWFSVVQWLKSNLMLQLISLTGWPG